MLTIDLSPPDIIKNIAPPKKKPRKNKKKTKKKRKDFPKKVKEKTLKKQNYKCFVCEKDISLKNCHFHHRDGDNSNNKAENCAALCPNHHRIITRVQKKAS